ncbi:MAG: polyphosphate kinase 2 [Candidatus Promineifilaceae bacterium]|jgi:polyphosphate kinase 2
MPKKKPSKNSPNQIEDEVVPLEIRNLAKSKGKKEIISNLYPYPTKISNRVYEVKKRALQVELLKLQRWIQDSGQRVILLFEGRDAAGKGGTIKRFMEHLNPRGARVVALNKPSEDERGQWYFQRYVQHLPTKGELVLFDRSWYNRAVVEPVMGFCSQSQHYAFLRQVSPFENLLIDDGIRIFKFWFSVSREEQFRRFKARETDALKQWKLSPVDTKGLAKWDEYTEAKKLMFMSTDTLLSPWLVIKSDDKKRARLACIRHVLNQLPYSNKDKKVAIPADNQILGKKEDIYDGDEW